MIWCYNGNRLGKPHVNLQNTWDLGLFLLLHVFCADTSQHDASVFSALCQLCTPYGPFELPVDRFPCFLSMAAAGCFVPPPFRILESINSGNLAAGYYKRLGNHAFRGALLLILHY